MPNTYKSNLVLKKTRHRGIYSGQPYRNNGRIFLPAGTVLGVGDILLGCPIGENQMVYLVDTLALGNVGAAAGSIGYFQILDNSGNPVVVQRNGPFGAAGTIFTSPASSGAAYKSAGALAGYGETIVAAPVKATGPVNVGVIITTGATVSVDTEFFIGCGILGENSQVFTVGSAAPTGTQNAYVLNE